MAAPGRAQCEIAKVVDEFDRFLRGVDTGKDALGCPADSGERQLRVEASEVRPSAVPAFSLRPRWWDTVVTNARGAAFVSSAEMPLPVITAAPNAPRTTASSRRGPSNGRSSVRIARSASRGVACSLRSAAFCVKRAPASSITERWVARRIPLRCRSSTAPAEPLQWKSGRASGTTCCGRIRNRRFPAS